LHDWGKGRRRRKKDEALKRRSVLQRGGWWLTYRWKGHGLPLGG
jgi:hypothetical protein